MGLKNICIALSIGLLVAFTYGQWQYRNGWSEGRAKLVAQQEEKARAILAKRETAQRVSDTKAAKAEQAGSAKTVVITREVVKYIQKPGRSVCLFDDDRVSIKNGAVDNANKIVGYDEN